VSLSTRQFFSILRCVWRDARVPLLARIFVVLAPLYWINPFDLIPDLQPGGYADDLAIIYLLLISAFRLIPKAVIRDSRRAAQWGRRAAVCGILCVTAAGNMPCYAQTRISPSESPSWLSRSHVTIECPQTVRIKRPSTDKNTHTNTNGYLQQNRHGRDLLASRLHAGIQAPNALAAIVSPRWHCPAPVHNPPIRLTTRSGQNQLYASDVTAAVMPAVTFQHPIGMPPQSAGGIFVGQERAAFAGVGSC
jgi:uncharacterized membrane protein YkvA (DUF1232 family)